MAWRTFGFGGGTYSAHWFGDIYVTVNSQNIAGDYSNVTIQLNIRSDSGYSIAAHVNGTLYVNGGAVANANPTINGNGVNAYITSWNGNLGHNSDGTLTVNIGGALSTGYSGTGSGSGTWSYTLPTIPRHAVITGNSGSIDDETLTYYTTYSNPAGTAIDTYLDLPALGVGGYNRVYNYSSGDAVSMSPDITAIRTAMVNTQGTIMRYVIHDTLGGVDSWSYQDWGIVIKNDAGQANPTFSTFTYADTNSTTTAITGNNQWLIQGYSTLLVTVSSGNKATPNKNANMDHYTVNIGGYSNNTAYSTSTVTQSVGVISDVTGARTLSVTAYDSRNFYTTVNQTVNILPYTAPIVQATASRANGYDDAVILTVTGSVSPLTLSGTDKNSIHSVATSTANRVEYRVSTDGGAYGSWTDLAATQTATTGAVNGNTQPIIAASGSTSSQHAYTIQVQITDKLNTTVQTINVPRGTPIFRIGSDGNVYFQEVAYQNFSSITSSTTPAPVGSASLNEFFITALAANATISAPSGTPSNGNRLLFRIKDNGTSRTLSWDGIYRAGDIALPTGTVLSKTLYVGFVYNSADSKWDCVFTAGGI